MLLADSPTDQHDLRLRGKLSKSIDGCFRWGGFVGIIAEIKRRSPSRGDINVSLDAAHLASEYQRSSVVAGISVLTDGELFGGSAADLRAVRESVGDGCAILRKDFLETEDDIAESKEMGADAVLLIVADLGDRLQGMYEAALAFGLDPLVEVRDEGEIETAMSAGAHMLAVNQRGNPRSDRPTLDCGRAVALARHLPDDVVRVAASGIGIEGGTTMGEIRDAGYHAALVGEAIAASSDPYTTARRLAGV